jgi:hypothetical protein
MLKKGILISGAIVRSIVGIGATALLFFGLKKKKAKKI